MLLIVAPVGAQTQPLLLWQLLTVPTLDTARRPAASAFSAGKLRARTHPSSGFFSSGTPGS